MKTSYDLKAWKGHHLYQWKVYYPDFERGKRVTRGFTAKIEAERWILKQKRQSDMLEGLITLSTQERIAITQWREAARQNELPPLDEVVRDYLTTLSKQHAKTQISLKAARSRFIDFKELEGVKDSTLSELKSGTRLFIEWAGEHQPVSAINTPLINDYLYDQLERNSPLSVKNRRRVIHTFFNHVVEQLEGLKSNPVTKAIRPKVPQATDISYLKIKEVEEILPLLTDELKPVFLIQTFCGLRLSEATEHLNWQDLEFHNGGHIRLRNGKTRNRLVKIPDNIKDVLRSYAKGSKGAVYVGTQSSYKHKLTLLLSKHDITLPKNVLRHTYCTYYLAMSQSYEATALQAGNSTSVIKKHYAELVTQEEGYQFFNLAA